MRDNDDQRKTPAILAITRGDVFAVRSIIYLDPLHPTRRPTSSWWPRGTRDDRLRVSMSASQFLQAGLIEHQNQGGPFVQTLGAADYFLATASSSCLRSWSADRDDHGRPL
jgi:hypothetical protein